MLLQILDETLVWETAIYFFEDHKKVKSSLAKKLHLAKQSPNEVISFMVFCLEFIYHVATIDLYVLFSFYKLKYVDVNNLKQNQNYLKLSMSIWSIFSCTLNM